MRSQSVHQHGWRFTTINSVNTTHHLSLALDQRKQVVVIYIDFTRAFGKSVNNVLLCKLNVITYEVSISIYTYRSNRTGCVTYKGCSSTALE